MTKLEDWVAYRYPTIMSGLVLRFNRRGDESYHNALEISASRDGVSISGHWPIMDAAGVAAVKRILDIAVEAAAEIREREHRAEFQGFPPELKVEPAPAPGSR